MQVATIRARTDGFGAHFQHYMWAAYYAEEHKMQFLMPEIIKIEHNYGDKENWIQELTDFMSLNKLFDIFNPTRHRYATILTQNCFCNFVESDIDKFLESNTMCKIRNKFFNDNDYLLDKYFIRKPDTKNAINIAIHVRRNNNNDTRLVDPDTTRFDIFKTEIDKLLLEIPADRNIRLHIISQASFAEIREAFFCYLRPGENGRKVTIALHQNDEVQGPFLAMATSDYLITSPSSFSYTAALLNKGTIIYYPFWHNPSKKWRVINVPKQNLLGYNC